MLYFQEVGPAEAEFEADPRHFLRTMLYSAPAARAWPVAPRLAADAPRRGHPLHRHPGRGPRHAAGLDHRGRRRCLRRRLRADRASSGRSASTGTWTPTGSAARTSRHRSTPCPPASSPVRVDPVNAMMPGAIERMAAALPDFRGATIVEGGRPLGAAGEAGRDQRRPAAVPLRAWGDLLHRRPGPGDRPARRGRAELLLRPGLGPALGPGRGRRGGHPVHGRPRLRAALPRSAGRWRHRARRARSRARRRRRTRGPPGGRGRRHRPVASFTGSMCIDHVGPRRR